MDIAPKPELRAACRIVLGNDDPASVITAMRAGGYRWAQVLTAQQAIEQLKALPDPGQEAVTRMFNADFPGIDAEGRWAIVQAAVEILRAEARAQQREADALVDFRKRRMPANER